MSDERTKAVRILADEMREQIGDCRYGTLVMLGFEGVVDLLERAYQAGHAAGAAAGSTEATRAVEAVLARLDEWTHEYGKSLCPGGWSDTFGEGMRAAKEQVSRILRRHLPPPQVSDKNTTKEKP